jgi:PAS domain S-box-containing protein
MAVKQGQCETAGSPPSAIPSEAGVPASAIDEDRIVNEAIIAAVPQPLVVLDADLRIRSANRAFYRTFRLSAEEMMNRPFEELIGGRQTIPPLRALLSEVLARDGVPANFEVGHDIECPGGRPFSLHVQVLAREDDRPGLILLILEDVTERKQMEVALRKARDYAGTIAAAVRESLVVLDKSLRVELANDSFYRTFHVTPAETVGQPLYELGNRQWDIPRLRTLLEEILPQGQDFNDDEVEHVFERLGRRTMRIHARRLDTAQLILLTIEDITEQKLGVEVVQRQAAILDAASDAIVVIDEGGIIDSVNPAAERIFGYTAGEMIGQHVTMLMPPPCRVKHDADLSRYLETGVRRIIGIVREAQGLRKDGSPFPIDLVVSDLRVGRGRSFAVFIRDISERKSLQKEVLAIAEREQRRIGQDLHDIIGQELTGLGLMAAGLTEYLEKSSAGEALAQKIGLGLKRALGHVRTLAKGLVPVEVDAQGLTTALGELADRVNELPGVTCVLKCEGAAPVEENATASQLYRVAREAVTNAVRHGQARHIGISLQAEGPLLALRVRDDGVGIADRQVEATGVGLRIMSYRAGLINATLDIIPAEGGGTDVICTLNRGHTHG